MVDWKTQRDLAISFFRTGMLGYGGGPSSIPLVHHDVVERYRWMDDEEFSDILALGNALPGPIATKMAGYIGYRVGGRLGLCTALLSSVMPTVILMILLIGFLSAFRDSPIVQGMTRAVTPVVGVMLLALTYSFIKQSGRSLGWLATALLGVISFVAYLLLEIHPAVLIALLLIYALVKKDRPPQDGMTARRADGAVPLEADALTTGEKYRTRDDVKGEKK